MSKARKGKFIPKRRIALCVGINDYPGTTGDLRGCVNDAADWREELERRNYEVQTVLNRDATRKNLLSAFRDIVTKAETGDSVVITYSGHGSFVPDLDGDEPDGTDECLCPYDIDRKGAITDDDLHEIFSSRARGTRLVLISDSCHSGTVARFAPSPPVRRSGPPGRSMQQTRFLPPSHFLSRRELARFGIRRAVGRTSPPGRNSGLLVAGCQDNESSWDDYFDGRPRGAFTHFALGALGQLPASANYSQWMASIKTKLPTAQHPQTPRLFGTSPTRKWPILP